MLKQSQPPLRLHSLAGPDPRKAVRFFCGRCFNMALVAQISPHSPQKKVLAMSFLEIFMSSWKILCLRTLRS